jgi:hypothetical protein
MELVHSEGEPLSVGDYQDMLEQVRDRVRELLEASREMDGG